MALQPTKRLFTVDEYYRMAKAGILGEDDRVELIEGEIVQMSPIGPRHAGRVDRLNHLLGERFGEVAWIRIQNPVRLSNRSEPEPDLALLRPERERDRPYESAHPTPADTLLVVEVAESSVEYDLGRKARVYARHGIAELWVLNLRTERLFVYRDATPRGYATSRILARGESISPLAFPEILLTVDEILG
ncbi:MAG: Uma2 family endonuclease [Chloroflexi bacterium]|nr:Uma2 family endonuclease [Chloroflexota bacterium]